MEEFEDDTVIEARGIGWNTPSAPIAQAFEGYPNVTTEGVGMYPEIGFNPSVLSTAKSYMECPICFEVLFAPIYQCPNGHIICNGCIDRVEYCGECRVPMGGMRIRNIALEQICDGMEVKCPHQGEGCDVTVSVQQLKSHLLVCDFRPIQFCSKYLGWPDCPEALTPSSIPNHLREEHQVVEVEHSKFILSLVANSTLFKEETQLAARSVHWTPILIPESVVGADLLLKCFISSSSLSITPYFLGALQEGNSYRVKFEINSRAKVARLEWTGSVINPYETEEKSNLNTFRVPLKTLKEFLKIYFSEGNYDAEDAVLKVRVAFWKMSEEDFQPFKENCFVNPDSGEKEPLDNVTIKATTSAEGALVAAGGYSETRAGYPSHRGPMYSEDTACGVCNSNLFGVAFRCLQCPTMYLCGGCCGGHGSHLMVRIPGPEQQALAEVVYESAAGELA